MYWFGDGSDVSIIIFVFVIFFIKLMYVEGLFLEWDWYVNKRDWVVEYVYVWCCVMVC